MHLTLSSLHYIRIPYAQERTLEENLPSCLHLFTQVFFVLYADTKLCALDSKSLTMYSISIWPGVWSQLSCYGALTSSDDVRCAVGHIMSYLKDSFISLAPLV